MNAASEAAATGAGAGTDGTTVDAREAAIAKTVEGLANAWKGREKALIEAVQRRLATERSNEASARTTFQQKVGQEFGELKQLLGCTDAATCKQEVDKCSATQASMLDQVKRAVKSAVKRALPHDQGAVTTIDNARSVVHVCQALQDIASAHAFRRIVTMLPSRRDYDGKPLTTMEGVQSEVTRRLLIAYALEREGLLTYLNQHRPVEGIEMLPSGKVMESHTATKEAVGDVVVQYINMCREAHKQATWSAIVSTVIHNTERKLADEFMIPPRVTDNVTMTSTLNSYIAACVKQATKATWGDIWHAIGSNVIRNSRHLPGAKLGAPPTADDLDTMTRKLNTFIEDCVNHAKEAERVQVRLFVNDGTGWESADDAEFRGEINTMVDARKQKRQAEKTARKQKKADKFKSQVQKLFKALACESNITDDWVPQIVNFIQDQLVKNVLGYAAWKVRSPDAKDEDRAALTRLGVTQQNIQAHIRDFVHKEMLNKLLAGHNARVEAATQSLVDEKQQAIKKLNQAIESCKGDLAEHKRQLAMHSDNQAAAQRAAKAVRLVEVGGAGAGGGAGTGGGAGAGDAPQTVLGTLRSTFSNLLGGSNA
jgi:hypothetical protein